MNSPSDRKGAKTRRRRRTLPIRPAFLVAIGIRLRAGRHSLRIAGATLLGSCQSSVRTNAACWARCYPHAPAGLTACYLTAVPFFATTLVGDAVFASLLFGSLAVAEGRFPVLRERAIPIPA